MIKHIRRWNVCRKYSLNGKLHKLLVLLGIVKSPTFELTMLPEDVVKFKRDFMNTVNGNHIE